MTPLEEVAGLLRDWPGRLHFIAVPQWMYEGPDYFSDWLRRIEVFYNLGSRIVKFHVAPQTILTRGWRLDNPKFRPVFDEIRDRKMVIMTHVGDPELWYQGKYTDTAKYGTRDEHYRMLGKLRRVPRHAVDRRAHGRQPGKPRPPPAPARQVPRPLPRQLGDAVDGP